jgi:hypothetical protein
MALSSASLAARQVVGRATGPSAPAARRPARRWLTALMLFVAASLAVAYIANAIAVNNLVSSIASLEREHDEVRSDNEQLRGELLRMMSVERVTALAEERVGLVSPQRPPIALSPSKGAPNKTERTTRGEEPVRR